MRRTTLWALLFVGGILYHIVSVYLGYDTFQTAIKDITAASYWTGLVLFLHWVFEPRTG